MSDGFFVDPEALSGACAGVSELLRGLGEFRQVDTPSSAVFGHEELAVAAAEFQERWQGGVSELVQDTEVMYRRLVDTVAEYRRADEGGAALFLGVRGEG